MSRGTDHAVARPRPPDPAARIVVWRPWPFDNPSLIGHAAVAFSGGWVVAKVPVFRTGDGELTAGVPSIPEIDAEGKVKTRNGKRVYQPAISFQTADAKARWNRTIVAALAAGEDSYRLTMALAGFSRDDLTLTVQDNTLIVAGRVSGQVPKSEFLHRGIAGRHFERRFVLADHIVVEGADLQNGLLHVGLNRVVPEALKLRNIPIAAAVFAPPPEAMAMANDAGTTAQVA